MQFLLFSVLTKFILFSFTHLLFNSFFLLFIFIYSHLSYDSILYALFSNMFCFVRQIIIIKCWQGLCFFIVSSCFFIFLLVLLMTIQYWHTTQVIPGDFFNLYNHFNILTNLINETWHYYSHRLLVKHSTANISVCMIIYSHFFPHTIYYYCCSSGAFQVFTFNVSTMGFYIS